MGCVSLLAYENSLIKANFKDKSLNVIIVSPIDSNKNKLREDFF